MSANKFSTFSEEVGYSTSNVFLTLITEEISYIYLAPSKCQAMDLVLKVILFNFLI